jgi:putative phage-type endonuclease
MIIHQLEQGSPEWKKHRSSVFNASDAPAMLGISPYKTRTELLDEYKSGVSKDVDAATQKRFDDGHRFEALARTFAEILLGEDLYPVVGTEGNIGASFDGITLSEEKVYESKTLNDTYRACKVTADLPEYLRAQMEQQLYVSGASECLFIASKWNDENELIEEVHFTYYPDMELRKRIIAGWAQFEKDLATHEVKVSKVEAKASAIMNLPTLSIEIKGEVTNSNLALYQEAATLFISSINTNLVTDQDFADAEASVKFCANAEEAIDNAKAAAIAQTASIDELMRTMDFIKDQLRNKRITLDKLVKSEKENRKYKIIDKAKDAYQFHLENLSEETLPFFVPNANPNFAEATKNKKTIKSMQDAVDAALANAKAQAEIVAADMRKKIAFYNTEAAEFEFLFSDIRSLIVLEVESFKVYVKQRIQEHKQREADKAAKIAEQEAAAEIAKGAEVIAEAVKESLTTEYPAEGAKFEPSILPPLRPTDFQIAVAVSKAFNVDYETVNKWLSEYQAKKAA